MYLLVATDPVPLLTRAIEYQNRKKNTQPWSRLSFSFEVRVAVRSSAVGTESDPACWANRRKPRALPAAMCANHKRAIISVPRRFASNSASGHCWKSERCAPHSDEILITVRETELARSFFLVSTLLLSLYASSYICVYTCTNFCIVQLTRWLPREFGISRSVSQIILKYIVA